MCVRVFLEIRETTSRLNEQTFSARRSLVVHDQNSRAVFGPAVQPRKHESMALEANINFPHTITIILILLAGEE